MFIDRPISLPQCITIVCTCSVSIYNKYLPFGYSSCGMQCVDSGMSVVLNRCRFRAILVENNIHLLNGSSVSELSFNRTTISRFIQRRAEDKFRSGDGQCFQLQEALSEGKNELPWSNSTTSLWTRIRPSASIFVYDHLASLSHNNKTNKAIEKA